MPAYTFTKLDTEREEIRLLRLQPGHINDQLTFSIFHAPLIPSKPAKQSKRSSIEKLQTTLPRDWTVKETLDGRYLFVYMGGADTPNSWSHPDPEYNRGLYELRQYEPLPEKELNYEALSYTWGSSKDQVTAKVTDPSHLGNTTIQIGLNLACALRYLRHSGIARTFWIDAICINQDDADERNAQVKRMGDIYSIANRVVVWLGEQADDSKHAFSTLDYLGKQVELCADNFYGDAPGAEEPQWH